MLDDMLGSMENIREQRVWQPIPDEVRGRFRETIRRIRQTLAEVHREFMNFDSALRGAQCTSRLSGWVQGGGTPVGMLAEMLAAGLNANVGGRDQIPLEVERQVTDWMRSLFGFPQSASGLTGHRTARWQTFSR